ncbi:MAG: hypothetical protein LBN05_01810 [Oscillospiraceae bacterium]|jgi:hypothetical protein|nr:hypothetical protein [Oscillospiraceae bacterium]
MGVENALFNQIQALAALEDGLDMDFTGTQWEAEWLANNKVCPCKACIIARDCLKLIGELEAAK